MWRNDGKNMEKTWKKHGFGDKEKEVEKKRKRTI